MKKTSPAAAPVIDMPTPQARRLNLSLSPEFIGEMQKSLPDFNERANEYIKRALRFYSKVKAHQRDGEHIFVSPAKYVTSPDNDPVKELDIE